MTPPRPVHSFSVLKLFTILLAACFGYGWSIYKNIYIIEGSRSRSTFNVAGFPPTGSVEPGYMFFFLLPILPEVYIGLSDLHFFDIIFLGKKGGVLTGSTTKEDVEVYKYLYQNYKSRTGPINYIRAALLYGSSSKLAQKITKPVLLIWGCRDLALEKGQAENCKEYAYNLTIKYLEDASHWVQMDDPERVNAYIKEFIAS